MVNPDMQITICHWKIYHIKTKKVPWNPSEQRHVKLLIVSTQIAPFRQGFELHSSISTYKTTMKNSTNQSQPIYC